MKKLLITLLYLLNYNTYADGGGVDVGNSIHSIEVMGFMTRGFESELHFLNTVEDKMNLEGFDNIDSIKSIKAFYGCTGETKLKDIEIQEYYPFDNRWGLLEKEYKGTILFNLNNCKVNRTIETEIFKVDL